MKQLEVREVKVAPQARVVATIIFREPINGYAENLRALLKNYYRAHPKSARVAVEIGERKVLFRYRQSGNNKPDEKDIYAILKFMDIAEVTPLKKSQAKKQEPKPERFLHLPPWAQHSKTI